MATSMLRFVIRAGYTIPDAPKRRRGGEDGYFLSDDGRALGVADGVGSWIYQGINPGIFTWTLMQHACDVAAAAPGAGIAAVDVLRGALARITARPIPGSCTVAVATLTENPDNNGKKGTPAAVTTAHSIAHIGDCGVMVIRADGSTAWRSTPGTVGFNHPHQLDAIRGVGIDTALNVAETKTIAAFPLDVVVMGSDGLFDNLFDHKIEEIVQKALREAKQAEGASTVEQSKVAPTTASVQSSIETESWTSAWFTAGISAAKGGAATPLVTTTTTSAATVAVGAAAPNPIPAGLIDCAKLARDIAEAAQHAYSDPKARDSPWRREAVAAGLGARAGVMKRDDVTVVVGQVGRPGDAVREARPASVPEQMGFDFLNLDGTDDWRLKPAAKL